MTFREEFLSAMVLVGEKTVAPNDVAKDAYYPNKRQRDVMSRAGIEPQLHTSRRRIQIRIAGTDRVLPTNYYESQRSGRTEPRMGPELASWVQVGDRLLLGTDGSRVFAVKQSALAGGPDFSAPEEPESPGEKLGRQLSKDRLADLANVVGGPPGKKTRESTVYERDPMVRAFARERSGGTCEMPGCGYTGFTKSDGSIYIEVHHIVFMGDSGEDVVANVAALCANCHKRAHYAHERDSIRNSLLAAVKTANHKFLRSRSR